MSSKYSELVGKRVEVISLTEKKKEMRTYGLLTSLEDNNVALEDAHHLHDDPMDDPNREITIPFIKVLDIILDLDYGWVKNNEQMPENKYFR